MYLNFSSIFFHHYVKPDPLYQLKHQLHKLKKDQRYLSLIF